MPIITSRSTLATGFALCIGIASNASALSNEANAEVVDKNIAMRIQKYVSEEDFRGTVLVAKDGQIVHRAAYGYADDSAKQLNKLDTRFLIGSLTKSFTAVTVMQLVERGKLDLHAPLSRYVPALKKTLADKLTLHRLLKHQSGLVMHLERLVELEEKPVSPTEILSIINKSDLAFEPGTQYAYSNLNYHLAAIAIENVTGKTYAQVLQELCFDPLKMNSSGVERFGARAANRANGYSIGLLGITQDENNVSYAFGSGDIYSTIDDLYRWDQALVGTTLLSEKSKALLFAGESLEMGNYGYGFRIQTYQRGPGITQHGTLVRHGGSMDGFLSNYHRYNDDKLTIIVLGNIRPFDIRDLSFELKEVTLGIKNTTRVRTEALE